MQRGILGITRMQRLNNHTEQFVEQGRWPETRSPDAKPACDK